MKTVFRNSLSKQVARLLIVALGLSILNNAIFLHAHRLPDGQVILHAHPYKKSQDRTPTPITAHHHTAAELFVLAQLQFLFFVLVTLSGFIFRVSCKRVFSYISPSFLLKYYAKPRGRSPPIPDGIYSSFS